MITRQGLLNAKSRIKKEWGPGGHRDVALMLVNECLNLQDAATGGQDQRDWAAERAVADKQVLLALADLEKTMDEDGASPRTRYTLDCVKQMLKAKLAWAREWSYYQPRIEEEFGA